MMMKVVGRDGGAGSEQVTCGGYGGRCHGATDETDGDEANCG